MRHWKEQDTCYSSQESITSMSRAYMLPSQSHEYETPHKLFDDLWDEFDGFDCDPCCRFNQHSAIRVIENAGTICVPPDAKEWGQRYDSPYGGALVDGLANPWYGKVYMNPPYGRSIGAWVEKAVDEVSRGHAKLVVALLPVRTDTRWWQKFVCNQVFPYGNSNSHGHPLLDEVRFLPGRLRFVGTKASAPFPSAIAIWA